MGIYEKQSEIAISQIENCVQNGCRTQVIKDSSFITVQEGKDLMQQLIDSKLDNLVTLDFLWEHRDDLFSQEMLDNLNTLLSTVRSGIKSEESYQIFSNTVKENLESVLIARGKTLY
jgi:hypothetical protein